MSRASGSREGALGGAVAVFRKEIVDALRDRRTLATVLLSAVLIGPFVLVLLSGLVATLEERAERRVVVAVGLQEHAPTLANFIERQTFRIEPAAADYEARLRDGRQADPVLKVEPGFEAALARGERPALAIVSDSSNAPAQAGAQRLAALVEGFNRERGALTLALRGVPAGLLQSVDVQEQDLAGTRSRAARFTALLPFFVLMAVLYGALHAALDTTAGERERGSLEPLLTNPAAPLALVLGKWAAVATVAMLIALLSVASFLPSGALIRSETLRALFVFGPREAVGLLALLAPLAAALSALLMAVAIRCRSFKEAQAGSTVVVLAVSLLPMVALFSSSGERPWFVWVPALAQYTLMNRVLRGEPLDAAQVGVPLLVSALLAAVCLAYVAARLRAAAVR
jgi:sodium transport system permease protein